MRTVETAAGRVKLGAVAALVACPLAGCSRGVLDPAGPVGRAQRQILFDALGIMLCIVVPTVLAALAFAWWFRASNPRARRRPDWAFSGRIEIVTWSVPLLTIVFLGSIAWVGSHDLDPAKPLRAQAGEPSPKPLEVQVVSLDWKWLFIYPEQNVASLNRLAIPAGVPVHFTLTSASVMNTFFVPRLGSMIYVMNGMADQLNLQADRVGTFAGLSGHYSGDGFSNMHFDVDAMTSDDFAHWVERAKADGPALDEAAYRSLSRQSLDDPPRSYRAVSSGLFDAVVSQKLPPGPGPKPDVSPKSDDLRAGG